MPKSLLLSSLILSAMLPAGQPQVRDHREVPGAAAQWKIGGVVDSVSPHALFNTARRKHLAARATGGFVWEDTRPGQGGVMFENCTRPGEPIYSSDRVSVRVGSRYMVAASDGAAPGSNRNCEFRLIPSGAGLTPAGSGDGAFAIYSMAANRYVVHQGASNESAVLRWEATTSGQPPRNVAARADFVPVEMFVTMGKVGDRTIQTVYLTIQNVGSVRSSASQQTMKVAVNDEPTDFLVVNSVEPGASLRGIVKLTRPVGSCAAVALDTNPTLKFQVGQGAFPNHDVFANDRKTMVVQGRGGAVAGRGLSAAMPCPPEVLR
jgi:hypothetical protein